MKTDTKQQVLDFIKENPSSSPSDLSKHFSISPQMVHRHLKVLLEAGEIKRLGKPPKVLYVAKSASSPDMALPPLPSDLLDYVNQHYLVLKPDGETLSGLEGFVWWARKTKQDKQLEKLLREFVSKHQAVNQEFTNELGVIDATFKLEDTFDKVYVDILFYQEFYSLPKFGKTRFGQMIFMGKSGQDRQTIRELADLCRDSILAIIKAYRITAVAFAPHSIPRKVSFLKEFENYLTLGLPDIDVIKVFSGNIPVAQKTLQKLSDRIDNAENTIFLKAKKSSFKRVLLIDDAVGSGATLNAIAKKLKQSGVSFVCGYAVTGSLKGFEVINEI